MGTRIPTLMGTQATRVPGEPDLSLFALVRTLRGAGSRAQPARDPAPLRYVGVRLIDSLPVDGPPSSAHSGRNCGGRTIGPALRAGRAFARIPENQPVVTLPL